MIDDTLQTLLDAACPFVPMGVILVGDKSGIEGEVVTLDAVLVLAPVWQGEAETAYYDPILKSSLKAGCTIILAFELREDFRKIEKLLTPAREFAHRTHPAPRKGQ